MTAAIFNFLLLELKEKAYVPVSTRSSDNCIIGIYHSVVVIIYWEGGW